MRRGIKKREHEKLSDTNVREVIELLESGKPFTKKEACQKLNITYNTSRLSNIITEFKDKQAFYEKRRSQNRGRPATPNEINESIIMYLNKEPVSAIASSLFRSSSFVKGILNKVGVPEIPTKENKSKVAFLPEIMIASQFKEGEIVWSAIKHGLVQILKEIDTEYQIKPGYKSVRNYEDLYSSKLYQIYVIEKGDFSNTYFPYVTVGGHYSCSLAYDLGKLDHLIDKGVDISRLEK